MAQNLKLEMKQLWAKKKFSVLMKSEEQYTTITNLLKNPRFEDEELFKKFLKQALAIKNDRIQIIRSYYIIFEMVQSVAKLDEKVQFLNYLDNFEDVPKQHVSIRTLLWTLAKRKNSSPLLRSEFFDMIKE